VVITYPFPRFPESEPMLWQADAGLRYRTLGGYVISPLPDGRGTFTGGPHTRLEQLFSFARAGKKLTRPTEPGRRVLLAELQRYQVDSILVPDKVPGAPGVVRLVSTVLRRPPDEHRGGVAAWYDVRGAAADAGGAADG
jgi:hypothetical protein